MPLNPTPRKYSQRGKPTMYVTSIADFERAQELQSDLVLDSAVDQLEAMNGEALEVADIIIPFGQMKLEEHTPLLRFGFDPPTTCKPWPGPRYGFLPLHKELVKPSRPKAKSSKKHGQPEERQSTLPRKVSKPKKAKKAEDRPSVFTTVKSRDPPLHLLSLPPELRNQIWNELSLHSGSLEAQLRQVRRCKVPAKSKIKTFRRFPLEPVVAMVNQQLRSEVLSIFYGSNRFVFEKNDGKLFDDLSITAPEVLEKWMSKAAAKHLTSVSLRFVAMTRLFPMSPDFRVVYDLQRLPTGKIVTAVKYSTPGGRVCSVKCICHETEVVAKVEGGSKYSDLAELAVELLQERKMLLFGEQPADMSKPEKFYPSKEACVKCGKDTFHSVSSGL